MRCGPPDGPLRVRGCLIKTCPDFTLVQQDITWLPYHLCKCRGVVGDASRVVLAPRGASVGTYRYVQHDEFAMESSETVHIADVCAAEAVPSLVGMTAARAHDVVSTHRVAMYQLYPNGMVYNDVKSDGTCCYFFNEMMHMNAMDVGYLQLHPVNGYFQVTAVEATNVPTDMGYHTLGHVPKTARRIMRERMSWEGSPYNVVCLRGYNKKTRAEVNAFQRDYKITLGEKLSTIHCRISPNDMRISIVDIPSLMLDDTPYVVTAQSNVDHLMPLLENAIRIRQRIPTFHMVNPALIDDDDNVRIPCDVIEALRGMPRNET